MEEITINKEEISQLIKEHGGVTIDMIRDAMKQQDLIRLFMSPPYNHTKEEAIMGVVINDYYADGTHMD